MRVCLIAPVPPFRGGIAKYCYSLAQELERRHDLLLLSYRRQYPELLYGRKSQTDPDFDRDLTKEFKQLSYRIDSVNIVSWFESARAIADFRADTVILPWWVAYWTPMYLYFLYFFKKRGVRIVFLCINIFEHENTPLKRFLTKLILSHAEEVVVHSEQERLQMLQINPRARVTRHLLPLFGYQRQEPDRSDPRLKLLFFGFVRPYKGLDVLLKALATLKGQEVVLKVVGEFWQDKAEYTTLIDRLGIGAQVEMVDRYVPDQEMSGYFGWADLVVLPYKRSITSGIIATAYGFGKPVLATSVGGFQEVVQDGYTGKIVAPDDPEALAHGIAWFIGHREIDFGANIERFTSRTMSWRSLVDTIEGAR